MEHVGRHDVTLREQSSRWMFGRIFRPRCTCQLVTTTSLSFPQNYIRHCSSAVGKAIPQLRERINLTCHTLRQALDSLLNDRQCLYRDSVLHNAFDPHRCCLRDLINTRENDGASKLTVETLESCRCNWMQNFGDGVESAMQFYNTFFQCSLVRSHNDGRLVLDFMQSRDNLKPNADTYTAIILSLVAQHSHMNKTAVDVVFYYFGNAVKTLGEASITNELWSALFVACAVTGAAPKLVDQWWDVMLRGRITTSSGPLPYGAVHAALTWASSNSDIERALRFFHSANNNLVVFSTSMDDQRTLEAGQLTRASDDAFVQLCQLRLLVKLLVTVKSVKHDGGLRERVVGDIRRLVKANVLRDAPWGVINDLLSGLSLTSAMQLLKFRSSSLQEGDGAIPFTIWASLLRRCARDHHIDQAEAVFVFIRKRFELKSDQKLELLEIMMRMFATLPQGDFASAMALFTEHVLHHPEGEPALEPNATMYNLLIRAADSRNTAMMTFLEACAAGVEVNVETFEGLMNSSQFSTIASLSRKLPHDYSASELDTLLHIPANVDAHLRREEAMKLRGKPLVDSTGEVN
uniref:Pentatricopeptide repeat-containing protein n=1 Tax=Trypanosoma vivax (strain Y486) TaxID=1055687 RepID=G0TUG7_TRYVY|nr:conserved hypothetical protein [Trypanosoma vivax Y486]